MPHVLRAGLTGMQVFAAMFAGELPYPPINDTLDFTMVEFELGRAVFQGRPMLRHYNPLGSVAAPSTSSRLAPVRP